jgi:UDP-N-acetylglucosamine--N-acetylmuramyl-(pentapeptide) pyrophosphoryl-undecaprenol N-acetylglucosamine transferase
MTGPCTRPILIMAGGTGGHVYPALAVAARLREWGVPLLWLGTRHGLEARLVPAAGYRLLTVTVAGLRGQGAARWLLAPFLLGMALLQSLILIGRCRPAAVLGMGGYASGPGGLAAWLLRVPLLLHEQNAVAGLTNRWLAPLARRLLEAFPGAFAPRPALRTGNPVRADIVAIAPPRQRLVERAGRLRLLVLGGSQGARALNEKVPELASIAGGALIEVWHQTGDRHLEATRARYAAAGIGARIDGYLDPVADAYAWADVVLCRAGAMTIAELAAAGVAAILVPYPHAVDDHQTANARHLSDAGAALLVRESEFDGRRLADWLRSLAADRGRLLRMAEAARALALPAATDTVARACLEVAHA